MNSIFVDSILDVIVTGSVVRLDCGLAQTFTNPEGDQIVKLVPSYQVVFPIEGFVQSLGLQERVIKQLIEKGVLKRRDEQGGVKDSPPDASSPKTVVKRKSPINK